MDIADHYRALLRKYGDSPKAAQYSDIRTQEKRLQILTEIGALEGSRVLDFGCGTARLATYLEAHGIEVEYTGVDIVPEFFDIGREEHPKHRFGTMQEFSRERFDYVFISGVFNNRIEDNRAFYRRTLIDLFGQVDHGLAFNMMSTYVDYQDANLFYEAPEAAFSFAKRELSKRVVLRHDYEVKDGVIPYEFAVYVYR